MTREEKIARYERLLQNEDFRGFLAGVANSAGLLKPPIGLHDEVRYRMEALRALVCDVVAAPSGGDWLKAYAGGVLVPRSPAYATSKKDEKIGEKR